MKRSNSDTFRFEAMCLAALSRATVSGQTHRLIPRLIKKSSAHDTGWLQRRHIFADSDSAHLRRA
jgi:hypothetical protein